MYLSYQIIKKTMSETNIINFWNKNNIPNTIQSTSCENKLWTLYDGPVFTTGSFHNGHFIVSIVKDTVVRDRIMKKNQVTRTIGNDCHGVPIERKALEELKILTTKDILNMGIDKFNQKCNNYVSDCSNKWQTMFSRIARWVDSDKIYHTKNKTYMESVWWSIKQLFDKKLIYQKIRIVPYSSALGCSLSNFEATLNYKNVNDTSATVAFKLKNKENTYLLAWTTTPWTLPSNKALCTNKNIQLVQISIRDSDKEYILSKSSVDKYFTEYKIDKEFLGSDLEGEEYESLFVSRESCKVILDDYVSDTSGTGLVHTAPEHGEDDFRVCIKYNIVSENGDGFDDFLDDDGIFTSPEFLKGSTIKQATKLVMKELKKRDILIKEEQYNHSYPMCWRTNTPLIYRAMKNWFVNVTKIKETLLEKTKDINWIPSEMGNRFYEWLSNARDWCISRSRFWGTPIPIYQSDDSDTICIGSIDELQPGLKDIHMDSIDHLTITRNGKTYKRIREVLDCWYESASMPFAQYHYPFENKDEFEKSYPAKLVVEGSEQYKLWFYVMSVLNIALFDKPAFENVICTGLVMAENGQKMSKSLGNFVDPMILIDKHGSDAMRLYFLSTPITRAENMKFSEKDLMIISNETIILLSNVFNFYKEYSMKYKKDHESDEKNQKEIELSIIDTWIIQLTNTFTKKVREALDQYQLFGIVQEFRKYINQLSNWYIKLNRDTLKGKLSKEGQFTSLNALRYVLNEISIHMAPIMPFLSETIFQTTRNESDPISVHMCKFKEQSEIQLEQKLNDQIELMEEIILALRRLRSDSKLNLKIPIKRVLLVNKDIEELKSTELFQYIYSECNILEINTELDITPYVKKTKVFDVLKLKKKLMATNEMSKMKHFMKEENHPDDCFNIEINPIEHKDYSQSMCSNSSVVVYFDPTQDEETKELYTIKLFCVTVQRMRKNARMHPWQKVNITYNTSNKEFTLLLKKYKKDVVYILNHEPVYVNNLIDGNVLEYDNYKVNIKVELK